MPASDYYFGLLLFQWYFEILEDLQIVLLSFRFQDGPFNPYHPYSFSACGMGSPGFYGPIGAPDIIDNDDTRGANSHKSSATTQGEPAKDIIISEDRKDNCGPTREAFMDPEFGGFYDDLAAGPPTENIPPGEMRFEKGMMG